MKDSATALSSTCLAEMRLSCSPIVQTRTWVKSQDGESSTARGWDFKAADPEAVPLPPPSPPGSHVADPDLDPKSRSLLSTARSSNSLAFTGFSFLRIFFTRRFVFLKVVCRPEGRGERRAKSPAGGSFG